MNNNNQKKRIKVHEDCGDSLRISIIMFFYKLKKEANEPLLKIGNKINY